jgi:hypothetical protein
MKKIKKNDSSESSNSDSQDDIESSDESNEKKQPELKIENPNAFFNKIELCHYKIIDNFFREINKSNPDNITKMIDIIEGKSDISLRILDWFVTKYSKKKITQNGSVKNIDAFDVKISYKAQLKTYKKRYFDPFRRKKKFFYPCEDDGFITYENENKHVFTTLGQLNFFKWALSNNIVSYVEENLKFIIGEMNLYNKDEKNKKTIQKEEEEQNKKKKILKQKKNTSLMNSFKLKENSDVKFVLDFD